MKNKLLTLLLSVLMITSSFTTRIFADGVSELNLTITSITRNDLPSLTNDNIDTVSIGTICEIVGTNFYLFDSSNEIIAYYDMLDWYKKDGSSYEGTPKFSNVAYVIEEIKFAASDEPFAETMTIKINDGVALLKIDNLHAGTEGYSVQSNTLYVDVKFDIEPCKTIADILGTVSGGFPTTSESAQVPDNAWLCNSNNKKIYILNSNLAFNPSHAMAPYYNGGSTSTEVSEDNNNYTATINSINYTFVMKNDVLSSIVCVSSVQPSYSGTYVAPTTIADVLPDDFPTETSDAWVNTNSDAYLMIEETVDPHNLSFYLTVAVRVDIPITSIVNGNNEYTDGTVTVKFNINNNELESIVLSGHANNDLNGTYVKPYTIEDVLAKSKDPFPSAANKAWVNDDGVGIYKDMYTGHSGSYEVLYITLDGVSGSAFSGSLSEPLKGFNNPYAEFGDGKMIFNISNGVLASIEIVDVDPLVNGIYKPKSVTPTPTPTPEKDETPKYKVPNTGVRFIK